MSLFRRKAKITSFVATGIRYDGSDVDSNIATDDLITTLELKHYIEDLGWEHVKDLNKREVIVKFPEQM